MTAASPWASAASAADDWHLQVKILPGEAPVVTLGPDPAAGADGQESSCSVFLPLETSCDGDEVPIGNTIYLNLTFSVNSVSTGYVRWSQVVDGAAVFVYSCKVPSGVWLAAAIGLVQCEASGYPQWQTMAHVRLFAQFLPSAGQVGAGQWSGSLSG